MSHFQFLHRLGIGLSLWAVVLLGAPAAVADVGTPGVAQLVVSCRVTWQSNAAWSKDYPEADPPYSMSLASGESIQLNSDLVFERIDGSWEIVDERTEASASGAGEYRVTGKNPIHKSVNTVLKDPADPSGYVSLIDLDFEEGEATIRFTKPPTTTSPECLECGFVALAAFMDCLSSVTNFNGGAPQECRIAFEPGNQAFTATGSTNWNQSGACGTDSVQANGTLTYTPGDWEVVILPPEDFPDWLPAANADPDQPGNTLSVHVQLRHRGEEEPAADMTGTFYVTLEDVSRQPGYCVNAPAKAKAETEPDLRLLEADNLWLNDGQSGQSEEDTNELTVTLESYDFGAYGRLRVEVVVNDGTVVQAHLDGDPGRDYLEVPEDDNRNHIADVWEREKGMEDYPATWDEADQPAGHYVLGDGISLYEKYRGFVFKGYHQRLEPRKKHLFVYDPTGWAQMSLSEPESVRFDQALDCEVLFVDADSWTGAGSSGAGKRIVNFNSTEDVHAVDQHGLHLRFPFTDSPTLPADYQEMYRAKRGTNDTDTLEGTFGCQYPDWGSTGKGSPVGALVIETYANNIDQYTREVVQYHTWAAPEFSQYWDAATTDAQRLQMRNRCGDLAEAYIRDHRAEFEKRNWLHFTTTLTHEVGHGVAVSDLTKPRNVGPIDCVMRYFSTKDFRPNLNDRFELGSRKPWPSIYCRSTVGTVDHISCWGQIEITDRLNASPSPAVGAGHLGAMPGPSGMPAGRGMQEPAGRRADSTLVTTAPPLQLLVELVWPDVLAGDPLRVQVTLASAAYQQALLKAMQTGEPVPPGLLQPTPVAHWQEGVILTLWRHDPGRWTEVLAREAWRPHLRPQSFSPQDLGKKPVAVSREWLAAPASLNLVPGDYSLSVLWDGDGLVEEQALVNGDYVTAPTLSFTVQPIAHEVQRAIQGHRRAFHAYTVGAMAEAWEIAQGALAITDARGVLCVEGTPILAANAAVRLQRHREAASLLQGMEPWQQGEPGLMAQTFRQVLAPEIALSPTTLQTGHPRLTLNVLPDQTYEVQSSSDLVTWVTLDQRHTDIPRYEVTDASAPPGVPHFYRAVWLP
jgi:hypothetical protein